MILFNLIFCKNTLNVSSNFNKEPFYLEKKMEVPSRLRKKQQKLAYILKDPSILSENKQDLAKNKYIKKNIGQNIVDNLWGKTVFLSLNKRSSNQYNFNLLNINKHQTEQKSLVSKFSRSLFDGSIEVSLSSNLNNEIKPLLDIEYLWVAKIKSQWLKIQEIFQESLYDKKIANIHKVLNKKLNMHSLPLFTVSNNLGQMIIAEPPTDLNGLEYKRSYKSVKSYKNHLYHGFFFTNYRDAEEYMYYIQHFYKLDQKKLRIFTCNFHTFYHIMDKFQDSVCVRLIPDLKEVSNLIKQYQYYRNISLYKGQNYDKNSFQGQPLYLIKTSPSNLSYNLFHNSTEQYSLAFLNYDDAIQVSNKLKKRHPEKNIKKINLLVYNLEQFIQDQVKVSTEDAEPYLIVPSKSSYLFIKQHQIKNSQRLFSNSYLDAVSYIILWSKRVFWSLTSTKP